MAGSGPDDTGRKSLQVRGVVLGWKPVALVLLVVIALTVLVVVAILPGNRTVRIETASNTQHPSPSVFPTGTATPNPNLSSETPSRAVGQPKPSQTRPVSTPAAVLTPTSSALRPSVSSSLPSSPRPSEPTGPVVMPSSSLTPTPSLSPTHQPSFVEVFTLSGTRSDTCTPARCCPNGTGTDPCSGKLSDPFFLSGSKVEVKWTVDQNSTSITTWENTSLTVDCGFDTVTVRTGQHECDTILQGFHTLRVIPSGNWTVTIYEWQ